MKKFQKNSILVLILSLIPYMSNAQDKIGTRAFFESDNKIYVVVMVLTTILIGIFIFLFFLERRIKKLEKEKK